MNPLVSVSWLAEHLNDPGLTIFDATLPTAGVSPKVDTHARYLERHLPGAVFFDIDALSDQKSSLPHMLPTAEQFGRDMGALGASDEGTLVVYEQGDVYSAPRAWWMLRVFGAKKVFLLDGGLRTWVENGQPTESGPVQGSRATFHAVLNEAEVKRFDQVQAMLSGEAQGQTPQILDARSAGRFAGSAPEPRAGLRSGHMPGALSVPYTELTEGSRMRTPENLRHLFRAKGVRLEEPITTTCGSGVTAAVIALGLEMCGAPQVSLYDGSWVEYAQHPEAVIETSS